MEGLYNGYISTLEDNNILDFYDFLILPATGDAMEYLEYLNRKNETNFEKMNVDEIKRFFLLNSHCSALIKLADDYSDIWFGHNTWHTYTSMIRIFKEYRFVSNKRTEKSKTIAFSSYPGSLSSIDDFYYLESKLLVMETTNLIFNFTLYKDVSANSLLTWVRVMIANRLASSAEEWTNIFKKENSGTYNDQFMILDINKIELNNKSIADKTLMIIEQIPEETKTNDVTKKLKEGYWPSYNIPYSREIYNKSGYNAFLQDFPNLTHEFHYNESSRVQIFKRDQNKIKSSDDFKKMLRYNDYENDNLSYNDSILTIAPRSDLESDDCFGATDVKFFSVKEILEGKLYAHTISGPNNEQQPVFSWKNTKCYEKHPDQYEYEGLVETWDFDWVDYELQLFNIKVEKIIDDDEDDDNKILIIFISAGGITILIIIIIIVIVLLRYKKSKDKLNQAVNQISFIDQDKDNKKEEKEDDDLLE